MADNIEYGLNVKLNGADAASNDLRSVADAIKEVSKQLGTINKRNETLELARQIKAAKAEADSFGKSLGVLKKLGIMPVIDVVNAGAMAINIFKETFKKAVVGIVGTAGQFEQWKIAFTTMIGSAEKAQDVLNNLAKFAAETPFQIPEVMDAARQLLAVGTSTDELIPTLKMLGDVAAGLSVPIERLILNFGQVRTQTYLTGRELRDFTVAGVPLVAQLAKQLNVSEAAIKDMVEKGQIGFDQVKKAFEDMSGAGGRFENMMDQQSKSLFGRWSRLKDQLRIVGNEIGTTLLDPLKEYLDMLGNLAEAIANKLKSISMAKSAEAKLSKGEYSKMSEDELAYLREKYSLQADANNQARETLKVQLAQAEAAQGVNQQAVVGANVQTLQTASVDDLRKMYEKLNKEYQIFLNLEKESLDRAKQPKKAPGGGGGGGARVTSGASTVESQLAQDIATAINSAKATGIAALVIEKQMIDSRLKLVADGMAVKNRLITRSQELELKIYEESLKEEQDMYEEMEKFWKEFNQKVADEHESAIDEKLARISTAYKSEVQLAQEVYDILMAEASSNDIDQEMLQKKQQAAHLKLLQAEQDAAKRFYENIGEFAKNSFLTYAEQVSKRLEIDKQAAQQREDLEKNINRKKEDLMRDFNRKIFRTIEEQRVAQEELAKNLEDLEIEKTRAVEDQEAEKRRAQEENAQALKNMYKKMAIDYLVGEAAKATAWFAAEIAKAIGSKNFVGAAILGAEAIVAAGAYATGISAIQGLATGGIVAGDGIYRMGEGSKKEAVIPLESVAGRAALSQALGNAGVGSNVAQNITLEIDGRKLAEIMTNYQVGGRTQGRF